MKSSIEQYVIKKAKRLRISHKYSQSELAHLMNLSAGFIGKVESPKYDTKYNLGHVNVLAKIFKCKPSDFLPDEPIE